MHDTQLGAFDEHLFVEARGARRDGRRARRVAGAPAQWPVASADGASAAAAGAAARGGARAGAPLCATSAA